VIGGASAVKAGLDVHWTPYIACADVDAAAARAVAAGGIVTTGQPADVPGSAGSPRSSTPRSRSS
jgi:predicted enzyme related to lactoylglutathione lyase